MLNNDMNRLFADGGINQQGGTTDPVSGNEVPPGSTQKEVRDDIPAQLSEGEFVVPADVVRYIGLERLMKLRDEAKAGLSRMSEIGQMGNADQVENPEALHGDEFGQEIDSIMTEIDSGDGTKQFAAGGFNEPGTDYLAKYNIPKTSITNPALDVRAYKNKEGRVMYITFFNDKPSIAIPGGYEFVGTANQFLAEVKKPDDTKTTTTTTALDGTQGGGGDGVSVGGGPSVGGSTGVSGTGIGNSAIGIAIGSIANAIGSITNSTPVSVSDAVTTTGVSTSANAAGLAANAAALAADDASISEGVTGSSSTTGNGTVGSTAATAAADNSGNTNSNDGGDGSGGGGGATGGGGGGAMAKGGLVTKRSKKPYK